MKKTKLAYYAGIVDGEGTISLRKAPIGTVRRHCSPNCRQTFAVTVTVSSTTEWLCQSLRFSFGGSLFVRPKTITHKPLWRWTIQNRKAIAFLIAVEPYLHLKRPQANLAITFQKHKALGGRHPQEYIDLEVDYKRLISSMNKRGNTS